MVRLLVGSVSVPGVRAGLCSGEIPVLAKDPSDMSWERRGRTKAPERRSLERLVVTGRRLMDRSGKQSVAAVGWR